MSTILVAEDDPDVRNYLGRALNCQGYEVEFAQNGEEVVGCLERDNANISLLLLDLIMPYKDGFETLKEVHRRWLGLPVITISGSCTPANVATVLKGGALDFLPKPVVHEDLMRAVQSALHNSRPLPSSVPNEARTPALACFTPFAGSWSNRIESSLKQIGASDVPVLLRGETGVGKEVLARTLHDQSKRAGRPFLKLNCAALPSELVESELFGYERGAFTGAFKNTPGKFEMANNGTILLDEIGDMDFKLQAKLLQVLQDREFLRLGAKETCRVDVRIMAATHCDIEKAITEGRFREDLYYRLNIIEVHVPPLRERRDEIISLAELFLKKHSIATAPELPARLGQALLEHDWPGNIRELENVIRKFLVFRCADIIAAELMRKTRGAVTAIRQSLPVAATEAPPGSVMCNNSEAGTRRNVPEPVEKNGEQPFQLQSLNYMHASPCITVREHTRESLSASPASANPSFNGLPRSLSILAEVDHARKRAEIEAIIAALNSTLWNRKQAAKQLKIDYKALLYKMKKLGIGEKAPNGEVMQADAS